MNTIPELKINQVNLENISQTVWVNKIGNAIIKQDIPKKLILESMDSMIMC